MLKSSQRYSLLGLLLVLALLVQGCVVQPVAPAAEEGAKWCSGVDITFSPAAPQAASSPITSQRRQTSRGGPRPQRQLRIL